MNILKMPVGAYQTNCYMVWGEGDQCVLIDPGYEANALLEQVVDEALPNERHALLEAARSGL